MRSARKIGLVPGPYRDLSRALFLRLRRGMGVVAARDIETCRHSQALNARSACSLRRRAASGAATDFAGHLNFAVAICAHIVMPKLLPNVTELCRTPSINPWPPSTGEDSSNRTNPKPD